MSIIQQRLIKNVKTNLEKVWDVVEMIEGGFFYVSDINGEEADYQLVDLTGFNLECSDKEFIKEIKGKIEKSKKNKEARSELSSLYLIQNGLEEKRITSRIAKIRGNKKDKEEIMTFLDSSYNMYFDGATEMMIKFDGKYNYLEYKTALDSEGLVGNISLYDILRIYNVTGKYLFKGNVRYGINTKKNSLYKPFLSMFEYLYDEYYEKDLAYNKLNNMDYMESKHPELFWFRHNGITFSIRDSILSLVGDNLKFFPYNLSVLNGTQTITILESVISLIQTRIDQNNPSSDTHKIEDIEIVTKKILSKLHVRCSFIKLDNSEDLIDVTRSLNTQNPVSIDTIVTKSKKLKVLNNKLRKYQIRIIDDTDLDYSNKISVKQFYQITEIIKNKPGTARNAVVNEPMYDKRIMEENSKDINSLALNIEKIQKIDIFLKKVKKKFLSDSSNTHYKNIVSNSDFYFKAYAIHNNIDVEIDGIAFYKEFIQKIYDKNPNAGSNDFKNNDLYQQIIEIKNEQDNCDNQIEKNEKEIEKYDIDVNLLESIIQRINSENDLEIKSSNSYLINKILEERKIELKYRTITYDIKNDRPTESFPLTNKTFSELYQNENYPEMYDMKNISLKSEFLESKLYQELNQKYNLFVLYKGNNEIEKIKYLNEIDFSDFIKQAEDVYVRTIEAFSEGNISLLPRESEGMGLHVRTKALDSNDTFKFTNGMDEVKRTFWINKESMKSIIEKTTPFSEV